MNSCVGCARQGEEMSRYVESRYEIERRRRQELFEHHLILRALVGAVLALLHKLPKPFCKVIIEDFEGFFSEIVSSKFPQKISQIDGLASRSSSVDL